MGFQSLSLNRRPPAAVPAASGHHLGAPDQEARIDTQGPANQAEHHDCANPNAAAGYGDAASILNPRALRQLIEAHDLPHHIDLWRFTTFVTVLPIAHSPVFKILILLNIGWFQRRPGQLG